MKILLVSMPTLHFFRWTEQLKNSGHEVHWFDIVDGSPTKRLPWVKKYNGWKQKYPNLKGRYFIKSRLPFFYKIIRPILERKVHHEFKKLLNEIKPDVVHSFALQIACIPILPILENNESIKWIYSSWGSDVYIFDKLKVPKNKFKRVLERTNYYFSDCKRDFLIVKNNGFKGEYLGCFPGGGGYDLGLIDKYISRPASSRHTILVKGYQGKIGRSLNVLKALLLLKKELKNYKIIVFSADKEIINFEKKLNLSDHINISVYGRNKNLPHLEIIKLMGESLIYIGNSISDGIPNTLLEAIIMGAFPIQTNPGGATEEIITHRENGLLINDPENIEEIKDHVLVALSNSKLIEKAFIINQMEIKPGYEINRIKSQVLKAYNKVEKKS